MEFILESIERIHEYTSSYQSVDQFNADYRNFDATMMNFVIIGEMVGKLSEDFKNDNPQIEWQKIKGFRNIDAHNYFGIDAEEIWQIIHDKLPGLKTDIEQIISASKSLFNQD